MTAFQSPVDIPVVDNVDHLELLQQHMQHKSDLDDAFSVQDDLAAAVDFNSDTLLTDLRLRPSTASHYEHDDVEDTHELTLTREERNPSVTTVDVDVGSAGHSSTHTLPPSSSSHSLASEVRPCTPPDDTPASVTHVSQLADTATATPLGPTHAVPDVERHSYPTVIIDASTVLPPLESQRTLNSYTSRSTENGLTASPLKSPSTGSVHRATQPANISPTMAIPTSPKVAKQNGPSVLQQVVSKTRPPYLPPKNNYEDKKHGKEWEEMMSLSRIAEQKRQEAHETRRLAHEFSVETNAAMWQRLILPDWKKAMRDPQLRKLWWDGVPTKLRGIMWERAVDNRLALNKDVYPLTLARAKKLFATRRFPNEVLTQVDRDISRTLPELRIFHHVTGPLHGDLRDLLYAWVVSRTDEGLGYIEGISKIGAMLLLNLKGPAQAFVVIRNLLEAGCLHAFYGGTEAHDEVEAYYRIFDTLLADAMPKVYFNFKQHQISPAAYLPDWLLPLFLEHLPLEACSRIWDVFLLEGDAFLFHAALAILSCLESRLLYPDRVEIMAVLKGESSAARKVASRSGMQGSPTTEGATAGPRYEIYGIDEEMVWERVIEMQEWCKESTWRRLTQRELPDL